VPHGHKMTSHEEAPHDKDPGFLITGLREPRSLLMSQFMHCKYHNTVADRAIRPKRRELGFPTLDDSGRESDIVGLERWLDHAISNRAEMEEVATKLMSAHRGDMVKLLHQDSLQYLCYSPWNPQSRLILAGNQPTTVEKAHLEPSPADVLAVLSTYAHVGTSELYNASACLLYAQLNDGALPRGCGYVESSKRKSLVLPKMQYHNIPQLSESDVPCSVLTKMDKLTTTDQVAYLWTTHALQKRLVATGIREHALPENYTRIEDEIADAFHNATVPPAD